MTQQYIIGQFSVLLEELQPPPGDCLATAVRDLLRDGETSPLSMLPSLAQEATSLSDVICWEALERGAPNAFFRDAKTAVALGEFTDSARLLPE